MRKNREHKVIISPTMPITPEDRARQAIDSLLETAGWKIQDRKDADLSLPGGVAVREFPMPGFGEADYLLFVDGKAIGVVEAKRLHTSNGKQRSTALAFPSSLMLPSSHCPSVTRALEPRHALPTVWNRRRPAASSLPFTSRKHWQSGWTKRQSKRVCATCLCLLKRDCAKRRSRRSGTLKCHWRAGTVAP